MASFLWRSSLARSCSSSRSSPSSSSLLVHPRLLTTSAAWNNPIVSVRSEGSPLSSSLLWSSNQKKNAGAPWLEEALALSHHHHHVHRTNNILLRREAPLTPVPLEVGVEQRTTDMILDALFSRQIPLPYGTTSRPTTIDTTETMETEPITASGMQWGLLNSDAYARRVGDAVSFEEDDDDNNNNSTLSVPPTLEMMNRNARRGKKANHGKRPCSRMARRSKKNKIGRRPRR
jgi:hypothetical protein